MATPFDHRWLIVLLALAASARADFVPLLQDDDLTGWTQRGGDPAQRGTFHVENGVIVGTFVPGTSNTFLTTDRAYGDFVLEFEFWVPEGVNSGVQFRSAAKTPSSGRERVAGYQFEIDPSARAWSGGVYHEAGRGWLYPLELNPPAKTLLALNAWNSARIECVGPSIRTWINGRPVAHLIDDQLARGFIALQVHGIPRGSAAAGRTVRWRHLRIDENPAAPTPPSEALFIRNLMPNTITPAEEELGWQRLFDGDDTSAWRGVHESTFPKKGWRTDDGALVVDAGGGGGDIVTRERYGSFELQLDVFITPGANSGIKYMVQESVQASGDAERRVALGLEYQILDDGAHADANAGVGGNRTLASLYDLIPSDRSVHGREVPRHVGGWNHGRVVCHPNGRVEHWLNGFLVVSYTRGDGAYRALVARSKYKDIAGFGQHDDGHLLLQDHGDEVRFRSIKVRRLE